MNVEQEVGEGGIIALIDTNKSGSIKPIKWKLYKYEFDVLYQPITHGMTIVDPEENADGVKTFIII
jgi:hypothetical protein